MPELDKNIEASNMSYTKFIRVGDVIYFSEDPMAIHDAIAVEFGVQEARMESERLKHIVDDAGMMKFRDGRLMFDESTTSTIIRSDKDKARKRTIELGKRIYGSDKVSDSYFF